RERPGTQIEQFSARAGQLTSPYAGSRFQHPQREEAISPGTAQEGLELGHCPHRAPLAGDAWRMRLVEDIPFHPAPGGEVLPGPMQHAMGIHDRLGLQARYQLLASRFLRLFGRTAAYPSGRDLLTDCRVVRRMCAIAPHGVPSVGTA